MPVAFHKAVFQTFALSHTEMCPFSSGQEFALKWILAQNEGMLRAAKQEIKVSANLRTRKALTVYLQVHKMVNDKNVLPCIEFEVNHMSAVSIVSDH